MKKILIVVLIASIFSAGCASTPANPVPIAQVGDETKTCDAIANEMQKMVTAKITAEGDKNSQVGSNVALGVTGIFLLGIPWFFMDLGGAATAEQKAAQARYERLQQMQIDKKCPATPIPQMTDITAMPFLIEGCKVHYQKFLADTMPYKAFAISADGHCGWKSSNTDATSQALATCKSKTTQTCKIYAINNTVVWVNDVSDATLVSPARSSITPTTKPMPASDLPNPAKKLEDLNTMLKKGLITQDEYNAKKTEILRNM